MKYDEAEVELVLASSFNRFSVFESIADKLSGSDYWKALRYAYDSSDNLPAVSELYKCFNRNEFKKECLMHEEERKFLESLSDEVIIYRGANEMEGDEFGCSWTLKIEVAKFFAWENIRSSCPHDEKIVFKCRVPKKLIHAYFAERNEHEVIVFLSDIQDFDEFQLGMYYPADLNQVGSANESTP